MGSLKVKRDRVAGLGPPTVPPEAFAVWISAADGRVLSTVTLDAAGVAGFPATSCAETVNAFVPAESGWMP